MDVSSYEDDLLLTGLQTLICQPVCGSGGGSWGQRGARKQQLSIWLTAVLGNLMLDLLYEDWRLGKDSSKADERSKQMAGEHNQAHHPAQTSTMIEEDHEAR